MNADQNAIITREIAGLDGMTVNQLQAKWEEVWQEPCHSRNKPHLKKRIAWRIQALACAKELADETLFKIRSNRMPLTANPSVHRSDDPEMPMPGGMLTRKYLVPTFPVLPTPRLSSMRVSYRRSW